MRAALLSVLAFGACAVERPSNPPADPPPGADDVEAAALDSWAAALGRQLGDPPPILWFEGACLDYSDDTYCEDGRTAFAPGDVEIHLVTRPLASQTALAHELLHWALHEVGRGWDGDHTADEWTLVEPLQAELAEEGM